ncbi:hypothetical protein JCM11251_004392 [Rhodosporidiobolus azoricus]
MPSHMGIEEAQECWRDVQLRLSGISSPSALLTTGANSTAINIYSIAKIGVGLAGFFAPALCASSKTPFKFGSRAFNRSASTTTANPAPGGEAELSIAVRLTAARDIVLGLLMRDTTSAVVVRALQADVLVSIFDTAAAAFGYVEGTLSKETATGVAGFALSFAAFASYILSSSS